MDEVRVIPIEERYVEGLCSALDVVALERRYIGMVEGPPLESVRTHVRGILDDGGIQMLAVTAADVVVGWCEVIRSQQEGFRHGARLWMGLLPEYRGRGLGKQLALKTIQAARNAGIERLELEVFASNEPALALYRTLGFVTEGVKRRARKLDGQYDDKVVMALIDECAKSSTSRDPESSHIRIAPDR